MKRRTIARSIYKGSTHQICIESKKRIPVQREVVHSITIIEGSIKGTLGTLVESGEEELLVEEDANQFFVITVINQDIWPVIARIRVRCAHTAKH
jgi:hypothetical protein